MKKFTEEQIEKAILDVAEKITENTSKLLGDNYINCSKIPDEIEDKDVGKYVSDVMVPISTAYQLSLYTMYNVLCELLCDEEERE